MDYEHVTIETPERVDISYELAGPASRLMAAVLDHLIIGLAISALVLLAYGLDLGLPELGASRVLLVVVTAGPLILLALYFAAFEIAWRGQTPGKRAAGLRVMRDNGTPAAVVDILIRNTVRIVDFLPYFYFLGGLVAFVQRQSKRLGDLAAGTVVVKLRQTELPEALEPDSDPLRPVDLAFASLRPSAARLSAEERGMLRRFLERRYELPPAVRSEMAQRIVEALRPKLADEALAQANAEPEPLLEALDAALSPRP
ncbi:MAG: RDD family protein [Armatimonadetes bacterium]|nr:RDD family protein [Armatimonadota bacterium]